jgi:hypothetical protein
MPPSFSPCLALLGCAALGLAACSSLGQYSTGPGESYCGGTPADAVFSTGLAAGAAMRLTLDATLIDTEDTPGTVWTLEPPAGSTPSRRLVDGAPLRRVPALENDPLGTPDLGSGRDHTRVFALTPAPAGEAPLISVLSLRSDGGVEVRLLRPGLNGSPPPGQAPLFGLFTLYKQASTCGF